MYWCNHCQEFFEEPDTRRAEEGDGFYGEVGMCPYCGEEDYEEAEKCEICGEWVAPNKRWCSDCEKDLEAGFQLAVKYVGNREAFLDYVSEKF